MYDTLKPTSQTPTFPNKKKAAIAPNKSILRFNELCPYININH